MFDIISNLQRKVAELEGRINRKVDSEDLSNQMKDVVTALGRKTDAHYMDDKLRLLKTEVHSEMNARPSRSDIKEWLTSKADVSEMDGLFQRAQKNTQSAKLQVL
eukprot:5214188-Pyramimonas_sp.AAC.1